MGVVFRKNKHRSILLVVLLALACARPIAELYSSADDERAQSIFVVIYGWHTGIIVKKDDLPEAVWPEVKDFPDVRYVEFGWGDGDYYQAPDPGLGLALKAAFYSSGSVLHVTGFNVAPKTYFHGSEIFQIDLSQKALQQLMRFISSTFLRSAAATPAEARPGLYPESRFYSANGKFHLFRNCNTWVAEALHAAGLPIAPAYAVTAGNLRYQVQKLSGAER